MEYELFGLNIKMTVDSAIKYAYSGIMHETLNERTVDDVESSVV